MYSMQFINKVLEKSKKFSIRKLATKYDISTRTIQNWLQGKLPVGKRNKPNNKLDILALEEDVNQHPDSYNYERAARLKVSSTCIFNNLKKLNITYKKNPNASQSRRRKATIISGKNKEA